jgi:hypothetical protein
MQPVLERCDREMIPAYLEASASRNRALYARNGFEVVEEVQLPVGAPAHLADVARTQGLMSANRSV